MKKSTKIKLLIIIINSIIFLLLNTKIVNASATEVNSFDELKDAIDNGIEEISIVSDFDFNNSITISNNVKINGNEKIITRANSYTKGLFTISATGTLEINNLTIDSGASGWKMDYDNAYYTGSNNTGYVRVPTIAGENDTIATVSLITNSGNLILNNTTLQNGRTTVTGAAIKGKGNNLRIEDTIFEKNIGLAKTSQSMGCVWLEQWNSTKEQPIIFKNVVFRYNDLSTGAAISDYGKNTYVSIDNIEVYNNSVNNGGLVYAQSANYEIKNANIYNNQVKSGSGFYMTGVSNIILENAKIKDNTGTGSGTGIYLIAGNLTIKDSEVSGNTSEIRGAGIFVRGYYDGYNPVLTVENTVIKNNSSATMGGGICVVDNEKIFSSVTIDDKSKIYYIYV